MKGIGIVGSGIAGLHLGLFLQKRGVQATLYSDRTPEQILAGRLPNSVARFEHTRARERELGVSHWEFPDFEMGCVHFYLGADPPLVFRGDLARRASFVDMRIYQARLLEDFASRGGRLAIGALDAGDVERLSAEHDLMVVASGRGSLTEMFPRRPERSPYAVPQRRLMSGLFRGVRLPEPLGISFNISPGHGEVFQAPFFSIAGRVCSILVEAVPGGELERIVDQRYDDDPAAFEATLLDLLGRHAPRVYERVDPSAFQLTRPLDVLQGAVTPVVRRGYARLENGRHVLAIGDVHVLNDPILGQGANAASHAAWVAGEAIAGGGPFDEAFCRQVEERIWTYARPVTEWTNAALHPPAPHVLEVFGAAAQDQAIADEIVDNFNAPARNWAIFGSPDSARAYLRARGRPPAEAAGARSS
ncbi:MAG TPA: styrene monooxygenase/indole monooxygenase family protein [Chloroflexota bacterium]|nr:styrene monooxygenase/indole monooxygenase family protein [Chloroflexota bacterium]